MAAIRQHPAGATEDPRHAAREARCDGLSPQADGKRASEARSRRPSSATASCALPTYLVGEDLGSGRLVRILPDRLRLEASAFAIYPQSRHASPKLRALIDYFVEALGPTPAWDDFEATPRTRARRPNGKQQRAARSAGYPP